MRYRWGAISFLLAAVLLTVAVWTHALLSY